MTETERQKRDLGDMAPEEFRKFGHQVIDWIADYLEDTERYPVLPDVRPGEIKERLSSAPPAKGQGMEAILEDFQETILPGVTHWNHPSFFSYFSISGSGPGILGELLSSALNVNAMLWKTSPAATELEEVALDWLRQLLGLPDDFWGIIYDTASISTLHALVAARESVPGLEARRQGVAQDSMPLRLYASSESHSSVEKAAITVGIGQNAVQKIPVDSEFRMRPDALLEAIQKDLGAGRRPFCVVATVGTTSTTSVDPVAEIAPICRQYGLWLHVDAAYAGTLAIVPELKWCLEGCEKADSIVVNPHKMLFTPIDLSAFYCRSPRVLARAFSLVPEYLKTDLDDSVTNYMDYGVQLGRRFRALKLWMVLQYFGREGIVDRLRQVVEWAKELAHRIDEDPRFERMAPTPFSTICFRALPESIDRSDESALDRFNERLLSSVNRSGEAFLSHTRLHGRFTLRFAIGNVKTEWRHIEKAWALIVKASRDLQQRNES